MSINVTNRVRDFISLHQIDTNQDLQISEEEILEAAHVAFDRAEEGVFDPDHPPMLPAGFAELLAHTGEPVRYMDAAIFEQLDQFQQANPTADLANVRRIIVNSDTDHDGRVTQQELNANVRSYGVNASTATTAAVLGLQMPRAGGVRTR